MNGPIESAAAKVVFSALGVMVVGLLGGWAASILDRWKGVRHRRTRDYMVLGLCAALVVFLILTADGEASRADYGWSCIAATCAANLLPLLGTVLADMFRKLFGGRDDSRE